MMQPTFMQPPGRRDWTLLAGMGLLVPAFLALFRALVLRGTLLRELGAGFIPLTGPINGIWPHTFYCIMHDLTHPLLLVVYAAVFAWLPLYARTTVFKGRRSLLLFCGILLLHCTFLLSYPLSSFLPVGDVVVTLEP